MSPRTHARSLLFCGLLVAACSDESSDQRAREDGLIGPEGGTLASKDQHLTITIPAGALRTATALTIESVDERAPGQVGGAFRIAPAGVHFDKPAHLKLELEQASPNSANLHVASKLNDDWIWYPTRPTSSAGEAEVNDTGTYSLVPGAQLQPNQAKVRVGQTLAFDILYCSAETPTETNPVLLGYKCEKGSLSATFAKRWSVNGVEGGASLTGTIGANGPAGSPNASALFTAPARKPAQNPVAVSVLADFADEDEPGQSATLVAEVEIEDEQPQPPASGIKDVTVWNMHYEVDSNCDHTWSEYGVTSERKERHTEKGDLTLRRVGGSGDEILLEGSGIVHASFDKTTSQSSQYFTKTRYDKGEGDPQVRVNVTIDLSSGAYDVYFAHGDITATYGGVDSNVGSEPNSYGPEQEQLSIISAPIIADGTLTRRLPAQGKVIEGNYDWASYWQERQSSDASFDLEAALREVGGCPSGKTSWTITPAQ